MRNSNKLVYGMGIKGNKYPAKENNIALKEYILWQKMLYRCTTAVSDEFKTYLGVTCSENFKSYTFFHEWCQTQVGFGNKVDSGKSWQLDKDLLIKGNKVYSEDTCCFIPARINLLLIKSDSIRGDNPVGVYYNNTSFKFDAKCRYGGKCQKYLGSFNTPLEAFHAYKTFKEALIKEVANEYKEKLDCRVYEALMNYEVNEND